ncbi:Cro/CI family transcriptional regulator [Rhizobium sp. CSW-27]|uniref:transcriptional regulator n=1 Tax=Rhizobium sp. CSW-27 TaxID=2839985 RepID=UPI001C02EE4A|nr:Cro/CI family transcriptional regulator [Rhizobium sp. CSW-27]MBT9373413.1 helix-turn-helix domain-containing protein [Rhizobium sp. CSW-27]
MIEIVRKGAEQAGGVVSLARELGIKHTSLYRWARVPAARALEFERITGISRHDLRPDVYGAKEPPE